MILLVGGGEGVIFLQYLLMRAFKKRQKHEAESGEVLGNFWVGEGGGSDPLGIRYPYTTIPHDITQGEIKKLREKKIKNVTEFSQASRLLWKQPNGSKK